ncbi:hypothetical protein [Kroppenstedtia sanguinis]|uniref:Uncharacterized protein n=1 Tax=Kroppenstedtia sanguinis TaxID=1380684 RepID=A0ABW4C4H5_9BACL
MSKRDELLERLSKFNFLPREPNIAQAPGEELERFVKILESMSERGKIALQED